MVDPRSTDGQPGDATSYAISALLIRNPAARNAIDDETLSAVIDVAVAAGWRIETIATDRPGRATEYARDAAARGVDVVVVHGGDGTINEVVNGLAGTRTAMATLRGGTANVWAKETLAPKSPVEAMRQVVAGERRSIDLGRAGDRYFLLMCGVGFDAEIIPRVGKRTKRWIGAAAYIIAGAIAAFRAKTRAVSLALDGAVQETPLYWMLLGNTRSYGGVANITYDALVDDGLLDVAIMRRGGPHRIVIDGARALLKRIQPATGAAVRSKNLLYTRVATIEIATPGLPVQIDGEPCGETPMTFSVAPGVLQVIVGAGTKAAIFSR